MCLQTPGLFTGWLCARFRVPAAKGHNSRWLAECCQKEIRETLKPMDAECGLHKRFISRPDTAPQGQVRSCRRPRRQGTESCGIAGVPGTPSSHLDGNQEDKSLLCTSTERGQNQVIQVSCPLWTKTRGRKCGSRALWPQQEPLRPDTRDRRQACRLPREHGSNPRKECRTGWRDAPACH